MSEEIRKIEKKVFVVVFISFFVFCLIISRLLYIQIVKGNEYNSEAIKQRARTVSVYPCRGVIYDRNLIPLTNREKQPTLVIFKNLSNIDNKFYESISKLTGYNVKNLKKIIQNSNNIVEIPMEKNIDYNNTDLKGTLLIDKTLRYSKDNILSHVIGYVKMSNNEGQSGLEKSFNSILKMPDEYGSLWVTFDGKNKIIPGIKYMTANNRLINSTNSIKLTVDYYIQRAVEDIMDSSKVNGAVIVAEVKSGDILAMVSRPNIYQYDIDKNSNSINMDFYNKAIQVGYPPGSIFKIVVLLAALEENLVSFDEIFYCSGYEEVGSVKIKCHSYDNGGHGYIDIKEAFYDSCNSVFIQIGKKIGAEKIIETAKRIGFGSKIEIGLLEEVEGNLPEGDELYGPSIGNISIGQGNIEVTPLQVTQMMMIIANNGIKKDMTIVDGIVTQDGNMVKQYRRNEDEIILSIKHAQLLKSFLSQVVIKGTAKNISLDSIGGGGGKTGSAQAIFNNKSIIHGWFSGYIPEKNPRYVITVLIERGESGSKSAAPIFEKIAKKLVEIESIRMSQNELR